MSIEVLLIPLGVAAVAAIKEARRSDLCEKCKATRISNAELLHEVLEAMGITVHTSTGSHVNASSQWGELTFQQVGEVWLGRVDNASAETTDSMLNALDARLGQVLQERTARQVVSRAESLGFKLIQQSEANGTLNYVFEEM